MLHTQIPPVELYPFVWMMWVTRAYMCVYVCVSMRARACVIMASIAVSPVWPGHRHHCVYVNPLRRHLHSISIWKQTRRRHVVSKRRPNVNCDFRFTTCKIGRLKVKGTSLKITGRSSIVCLTVWHTHTRVRARAHYSSIYKYAMHT